MPRPQRWGILEFVLFALLVVALVVVLRFALRLLWGALTWLVLIALAAGVAFALITWWRRGRR